MAISIPDKNDKHIPLLIKKLETDREPILVNVVPEINSKTLDCFMIVKSRVRKSGGRMVLGWQIWKSSNLIEAEFHAIWESEKNELIDVTPKQIQGCNKTLFIIDERLKYENKQIDNIRINITKNKLVDDFISICEAIFIFENKGERAFQYGSDFMLNDHVTRNHIQLETLKNIYLEMISNKATKNSKCLCGSGIKFKHCHGKDLSKQIARLI